LYLHCTGIYKGAGLSGGLRSIVILTMTSFARGPYQDLFRTLLFNWIKVR
jgi:hypothetical protein